MGAAPPIRVKVDPSVVTSVWNPGVASARNTKIGFDVEGVYPSAASAETRAALAVTDATGTTTRPLRDRPRLFQWSWIGVAAVVVGDEPGIVTPDAVVAMSAPCWVGHESARTTRRSRVLSLIHISEPTRL